MLPYVLGAIWAVVTAPESAGSAGSARFDAPMRPITLEDAVAWALLHNPELAAFEWELRAVEARAVQARLRHNPELRLEVEEARLWPGPSLTTHSRSVNLGLGSAEFELPLPSGPQTISVPRPATSWRIERETEDGAPSGFGEAEVTLSLSQVIELGGKRAARLRQARREHEVAAWDYEAARANVLAEVAAAFVDVSVAQRRVELDRRLERIEDERRGAIDQSVASGKVSPLESEAAATAVSLAKVRLIASEQGLARARVRLAATWGSHFPGFARVDGRLDALSAPAPLETLLALREQNPDVARWSAELALREAGRDVARSRGVPDLTVTFGFRTQGTQSRSIRRFGFGGGLEAGRADLEWDRDRDNTFVFGASMPLPVFNRNQGAIRESEYQISQATEQRQAADARAMVSITQAHQELAQALETLRVLDEEVVPAARRTFEQTKAGHEKGKFGYRDVLDAERALLEVDHRRIDALHAYHDAAIRLDRLTGSLPPDDDTEE